MRLTNKVIVVTGATGLLGRQHCIAALEEGAEVIGLDIESIALTTLQEELSHDFGDRFLSLRCDITDESELLVSLDIIKSKFGVPTGLVNNAAINPSVEKNGQRFNRIEDFKKSDWDMEFDVGLWGAFLCSRVFGSEMVKNGIHGSIVNISSDHGLIAPNQNLYRVDGVAENEQPVKPITYSVIKHGLIGMTRYLATYWSKHAINVNTLCPGGVLNGQNEDFIDRFQELVPLGRLANPDEYRGALVFLLSSESSYMTGSTMVIDGGRSVW